MSGYQLETLPRRPLKKSDVPLLYKFSTKTNQMYSIQTSLKADCVGLEMDGYWSCQIAVQYNL